jgi:hypothetical protein
MRYGAAQEFLYGHAVRADHQLTCLRYRDTESGKARKSRVCDRS